MLSSGWMEALGLCDVVGWGNKENPVPESNPQVQGLKREVAKEGKEEGLGALRTGEGEVCLLEELAMERMSVPLRASATGHNFRIVKTNLGVQISKNL